MSWSQGVCTLIEWIYLGIPLLHLLHPHCYLVRSETEQGLCTYSAISDWKFPELFFISTLPLLWWSSVTFYLLLLLTSNFYYHLVPTPEIFTYFFQLVGPLPLFVSFEPHSLRLMFFLFLGASTKWMNPLSLCLSVFLLTNTMIKG